jgi:hypothetical protein
MDVSVMGLIVFDLLAARFGVDSRDGITDLPNANWGEL